MELLPKSSTDFKSENYWNQFFSKRGKKAFEWYGEYVELCSILHKYMRLTDAILVPGCGNSTLSADLYKVGFQNITNVDISDIVISQMKNKYSSDEYPEMKWLQRDVFNLGFEDESFSCILDKGTLDAILGDVENKETSLSDKYFNEINRVMKNGGRFICISLLQEHILNELMKWFPAHCWIMRFCRCEDAEKTQPEAGSFTFPVFVVICTKFKQMSSFTPIIELDLHEGSLHRVKDFSEVVESVTSLQQYALIKHNLNNKVVAGEEIKFELCDPKSGRIRYKIFIVDSPKCSHTIQFAVFIVPHGREREWLFSNPKGQLQLAESASANRLAVVHLMKNQTYGSIQDVQNELSAKVVELAPKCHNQSKIPFLSVGNDLGQSREVFRGRSHYSGEFVIEDVVCDSYSLRRLIFLDQHTLQSECKLIPEKKKGRKNKSFVIDFSYLSYHHCIMVGSLEMVSHSATILQIGLGGGALANYLHQYFPEASITAVDIDESMLEIAKTWFGFKCSDRLLCKIEDGIDFIKKSAKEGQKYDIIMFDVDSKESDTGLSCPSQNFLETDFLDLVASCISSKGLFLVNLVCRNINLKSSLLDNMKRIFQHVSQFRIPEEVNDIIFCSQSTPCSDKKYIEKCFNKVNQYIKNLTNEDVDIVNVDDVLSTLQVVHS